MIVGAHRGVDGGGWRCVLHGTPDTLQTYLNFLCSMLVLYQMPICFLHIFTRLSLFFRMFSYTNILTRCPRPVAVFCMFLDSGILLMKYSRNGLKIYGDQFLPGTKTKSEGDPEGATRPPKGGQARPHPRPCPGDLWGPWPPPHVASSPIRCP